MRRISGISGIAIVTVTAVAAGCGATYGGPAPLSDFPNKSLVVTHNSGYKSDGFTATLHYDDIGWCDVLQGDAFARLNGRSVPLFRGKVTVIPPQGDDGGVECTTPSVTLDQIPADLSPPWTIEIGDASQTLSATFSFDPSTPVVLADPVLTSDALTLTVQRQPGDTTLISGSAMLTGPDGQSGSFSQAQAGESEIAFPVFSALWPPGSVAVSVVLDYFSPDQLLDCQAPSCTLTTGSGVYGAPTTSTFTVQHVIRAY